MSSERRRHNLYEEAKRVFSEESADELMSYLPPVGWADVATKADVGMIRLEMDALRAELRGEMAELRGEMAELRGETAAMGSELRGEFKADLADAVDRLRTWTLGTMVALTGMVAAVTVGASQLGR